MALALASLIALPGGVGTAIAVADGGNSTAVAINTKDDSSVYRLAFHIFQVMGNTVDNQNAAVAFADCNLCQTVAISIQTVLVAGYPTVFEPVNEAIAINQSCNSCVTLALAYQFIVGVGSKLKFTAEGRQAVADIRRQLDALRNSGLSGTQIEAAVSGLMTQYAGVLQTQLIPVNQPAAGPSSPGSSSAAPTGTAPASTAPSSTSPTDTTTSPTSTTAPTTTATPTDTTTAPSTTPTATTGTGTTTTPTSTSTTPTSTTP